MDLVDKYGKNTVVLVTSKNFNGSRKVFDFWCWAENQRNFHALLYHSYPVPGSVSHILEHTDPTVVLHTLVNAIPKPFWSVVCLCDGSDGKESAYSAEDWSLIWVRKIPRRREWQPTLVFVPGTFRGQKSLAGYSPWGRKQSYTSKRLALSLSYLLEISTFSGETRKQSDSGHYYERRYAIWKNHVNFAVTRLEQVIVSSNQAYLTVRGWAMATYG